MFPENLETNTYCFRACDVASISVASLHMYHNFAIFFAIHLFTVVLQLTTIVSGVIQQRRGVIDIEDYYQPLISPEAVQLDSRQEDQDLLYFSDYFTGYIYSVRRMRVAAAAAAARPGAHTENSTATAARRVVASGPRLLHLQCWNPIIVLTRIYM